jgi:diguanylate cyclase (GGDEF)-like protein
MSVLPWLVSVYLVSKYILPRAGLQIDVAVSMLISVFIAAVGFLVIKQVFDRVVSISTVAKMIAAGDVEQNLEAENPDELGDLGDSLNQLTRRIRSNMDELKSYGEKTAAINMEIQKRVIVLSSLLQVSSLISQGAKLEEILKLIVEKSRLLADSDTAYLLFRKEGEDSFHVEACDGINAQQLTNTIVEQKDSVFGRAVSANKAVIVDKGNPLEKGAASAFFAVFGMKNTLALPVYLGGRVIALLGIGDAKEAGAYNKDDIDLLDIFAKQVAIAVENDILTHHVEKLEIKDALTGLYNRAFIKNRLEEEIKRAIAYQRPCSFVLFDVDNFQHVHALGSLQCEAILKKVAYLIRDSITEIDRAGRIGDDEFALLLPEKNKRQAQEIAEAIRKKVEFSYGEESDPVKKITLSAGISENPLDGVEGEELMAKARELLDYAKKIGKNRVVAFKDAPACR